MLSTYLKDNCFFHAKDMTKISFKLVSCWAHTPWLLREKVLNDATAWYMQLKQPLTGRDPGQYLCYTSSSQPIAARPWSKCAADAVSIDSLGALEWSCQLSPSTSTRSLLCVWQQRSRREGHWVIWVMRRVGWSWRAPTIFFFCVLNFFGDLVAWPEEI